MLCARVHAGQLPCYSSSWRPRAARSSLSSSSRPFTAKSSRTNATANSKSVAVATRTSAAGARCRQLVPPHCTASETTTASNSNTGVMSKTISKRKLGWSEDYVSSVCLGTMTFGVQNDQEQAFQMMDYYVKECGGNLLDVAEMYPAPASDPRWFPGTR